MTYRNTVSLMIDNVLMNEVHHIKTVLKPLLKSYKKKAWLATPVIITCTLLSSQIIFYCWCHTKRFGWAGASFWYEKRKIWRLVFAWCRSYRELTWSQYGNIINKPHAMNGKTNMKLFYVTSQKCGNVWWLSIWLLSNTSGNRIYKKWVGLKGLSKVGPRMQSFRSLRDDIKISGKFLRIRLFKIVPLFCIQKFARDQNGLLEKSLKSAANTHLVF